MNVLHAEIGSAKDNLNCPIHNWYKFSAGFSHRFVEQIIEKEKLKNKKSAAIFDPFAGCGTTLVCSQKTGIRAIGNEAQEFMHGIIRAKLSWRIYDDDFERYLRLIKEQVIGYSQHFNHLTDTHPLLRTLYDKVTLKSLYLIRDSLYKITSRKYKQFFSLALSQTLHKVSINPIAVPYIVRGTTLANDRPAWDVFESISRKMLRETQQHRGQKKTTKVYLHDSRKRNSRIADRECSICITSPPYLNNLDYGEMSKVHSYFWELADDWNDITKKVRKRLVTASTTHYRESEFSINKFKDSEFYKENRKIAKLLLGLASDLRPICKTRSGRKSFDILALLYFSDMYQVLKEIRRTLDSSGKAYLILGDSAPYGVYIPTTKLIARISKNAGFNSYRIHRIRTRGTKWRSLRYRHSRKLTENLLILQ